MNNCKRTETSMESGFQLNTNEENIINNIPYREMIGSFMYVTLGSRPDIMCAISYLSQFLDLPSEKYWKAVKRIIRYLKKYKKNLL